MVTNTTIIMGIINIIIKNIIIKKEKTKSTSFAIFNKNNHNTKECWFNGLNKSSALNKYALENYDNTNEQKKMKNKPLKKISGYINQYNINEQYNDNVNFEDIRPLLKEKKNIKRTVGLINHAIELTKTIKENEIHNINLNNNACSINNFNKSYWLFDSGAGEHLTNNINLLKNFKEEKITLRCANNTICTFDGYGEFTFKINSYKINLKRVLYSKDVVKNIISGNELIKLGIIAITEPTNNDMVKLTLKDLGGNVIGTFHSNEYNEIIIAANHNNEMEYSTNKNIFTTKKINEESRIIWHRRLGHYYLDDLPKFLELHNIKEPLCEDCKISKMKRSPHNKYVATHICFISEMPSLK